MKAITFILTLFLNCNLLAQDIEIIKIIDIDDDGLGAVYLTNINRLGTVNEPFKLFVSPTTLEEVEQNLMAEKFEFKKGYLVDTIVVFDKEFKYIDDLHFHESNLSFNKDTTKFKLSNKNRVTGAKDGLKVRNNLKSVKILIIFPAHLKYTNIETEPYDVDVDEIQNVVMLSGNDVNQVLYDIEYKKVEIEKYKKGLKKEIVKREIEVKKSDYTLAIWDDKSEDGDVISLYFNGKLILKNYSATNEPLTFPMPFSKAKQEIYDFVIVTESEGLIKPNTVKILFEGEGVHQEIPINTKKNSNAILRFKVL